ncbi:MAG: (2Fe-2S) ferredoxin domain-containing protein [Cyanobacteria bacterium J06639_1]
MYRRQKGTSKLKALILKPQSVADPVLVSSAIAPVAAPPTAAIASAAPEAKPKKQKILVCQKSSCCKRGARKVWDALATALDEADLSDRVQLKSIGCIDKCKQGGERDFQPRQTPLQQSAPRRRRRPRERTFRRSLNTIRRRDCWLSSYKA